MRNQVARHMNTFNKNSVHKNIRRNFILDDEDHIEEGIRDYSETLQHPETEEDNKQMVTPKWLQNIQSNAIVPISVDKTIPLELIDKYRKDCTELLSPNTIQEIEQKPGDETNPIHLIWMLKQIAEDKSMSLTKRHRWLGYIQGILVMKGSFTVEEEREYTRPMFNGS